MDREACRAGNKPEDPAAVTESPELKVFVKRQKASWLFCTFVSLVAVNKSGQFYTYSVQTGVRYIKIKFYVQVSSKCEIFTENRLKFDHFLRGFRFSR
jgi:hypothetical protein